MTTPTNPAIYCLAGATATGKSALVQALAEQTGAIILSADAMLVYEGMNIGTAKPTPAERAGVPYFGLDCVTPAQPFSVADWLPHAQAAQAQAAQSGRPLFVTGGTGLYFTALLRGLDPTPPRNPALTAELEALPLPALQARLAAHHVTLPDLSNPRRLIRALEILESGAPLPSSWLSAQKPPLLALTWARPHLHERIAQRVDQMFAQGLLAETEHLLARHPQWSRTAAQAIGYAEAIACLKGRLTREQAREQIIIRTRQLARRQETYLRHQFAISWLTCTPTTPTSALLTHLRHLWHLP